MKEGWEYKTLGEVANVIHGKNQKEVLSKNGKYPIYGSGGTIMGYATDFLCHAGTTILGRKGSINNPIYIEEDFWNVDTAFGISAKENVSSKFVYYYCKNKDWGKLNTGTTLPSLTQSVVKSQIIPIPRFTKQEEIVSYLDTTFANIDKVKENASKALSEAKALFKAALEEAMMPKEGWEEKTLGEIAEIKGGKRVPKGYSLSTIPTKHKYIRVADFNDNGTVDINSVQYISDDVYNQIQRYTISSNDVYVSIAGTIGKTGIIPQELDGANLTENACKLIIKTNVDKFFLYYFTRSKLFIGQIDELTRKSAQPKLALTRLAKVVIPYPSISEQQKIVRHLDSLSSKARQMEENYRKTLAECDALKQAILRDVFE